MNCSSIEKFANYVKHNYLEAKRFRINETDFSVSKFVYSCNDPWLYIMNGELSILRLIGYSLCYERDAYWISESSRHFQSEIRIGDHLISVNGLSVEQLVHSCITEGKMKVVLSRNGRFLQTQFTSPDFVKPQQGIELQWLEDNTGNIVVRSFDIEDMAYAARFIENCNQLTIDLRGCTGGSINQMLRFLALFALEGKPIELCFENSQGAIGRKRLESKFSPKTRPQRVDLLVGSQTASSAEIFCVGIKTAVICRIIGSQTAGKLVIQEPVRFESTTLAIPVYKLIKPTHLNETNNLVFSGDSIVPDLIG